MWLYISSLSCHTSLIAQNLLLKRSQARAALFSPLLSQVAVSREHSAVVAEPVHGLRVLRHDPEVAARTCAAAHSLPRGADVAYLLRQAAPVDALAARAVVVQLPGPSGASAVEDRTELWRRSAARGLS